MKFLVSLLVSGLVVQNSAFAAELPSYIANDLDRAVGATAVYLDSNKLNERVTNDQEFHDRVDKYVKRFDGKLETSLSVTQATSSTVGTAALASALVIYILTRREGPKNDPELFSWLSSIGGGASVSSASGSAFARSKNVPEKVLNDEKVDKYVASMSASFGELFSLSKARENAIRFAFKNAIYEKAKTKDDKPVNIFEIAREAKFGEGFAMSEGQRSTLMKMEEFLKLTRSEIERKQLTEAQKISYLQNGVAIVEAGHKLSKPSNEQKKHAEKMMGNAKQVLQAVQEYRAVEAGKEAPVAEKEEKNQTAE